MLPKLTAIHFERFMTSGRTSPALCGCEDHAGKPAGEYVVKLRGTVGATGLLNELFAAKLAGHFGLQSPEPALITIESTLAELIASYEPARASNMRAASALTLEQRL
ncbi:MAG TPA: HipA family kinase [Bryobacteraceae bacterium]|nr:HipA family kinase [Bryobacteraceae bacterium]